MNTRLRATLGLVGAVSALLWFAGCSADEPGGIAGSTVVQGDASTVNPCQTGTVRSCGITLGEHNGVLSCYQGSQSCTDGVWSECANGQVRDLPAPPRPSPSGPMGPGLTTTAIGNSSACVNNPCDPSCQNFDGDPDVISIPTTPDGGFTGNYVGGSLATLPNGLVNGKGIVEPCMWGADCQFNYQCTDVATDTSCGHSKCTTGDPMSGSCTSDDPCVKAICAQQDSCCGTPCAHDPCVVGVGLAKSCDTCVSSICDTYPTCCTGQWTAACAAAVATVGGNCAAKKCACSGTDTHPAGDDAHCYRYVIDTQKWADARDACRAIGGGSGWDLVKITDSTENTLVRSMIPDSPATWIGLSWNSGANAWRWADGSTLGSYSDWATSHDNQDCARMKNGAGTWNDLGCNNQRPYVCEGPGTILTPKSTAAVWDASCVSKVATVCGAKCGTLGAGTCEPRAEGSVDDTCNGIDLSVGVPCDNKIPICNHGKLDAPAHIPIEHFPGNSPQYGICNPSPESKMVYCETQAPIPSGQCIWVDNCGLDTSSVGSNRQIYVNAPGYPNASHTTGQTVAECSCLDNWSESHRGVPCLEPVCATATASASLKTVNMYLIVDKSTSMAFDGASSYGGDCTVSAGSCNCDATARWTGARNALTAFFQSPQLAGINVSLEFYPLGVGEAASGDNGCGTALGDCDATPCQTPLVPLGALQAASAPTDTQEFNLVNYMTSVCPIHAWGTPTYPALDGTLKAAIAHKATHPDEIHVAVLVTDGEPNNCSPTLVPNLAKAAFTNYGVRTYAVGIGTEAGISFLDTVASNGGTGSATVIDLSDPSTVASTLYNALLGIATNAASCEFDLPDLSQYDPGNVTVLYMPGDPKNTGKVDAVTFDQSTTAGSGCDWYFDNNTNPTKITLCASACQTVQSDPLAQMSVLLGCPTNYDPAEGSQVYAGTCPPGTRVQWGFFSYATTTPGDSRVEFQFRTAETEATLAGSYVLGATAQASPNTQLCPMTGGTTGCPVDLYNVLGTPADLMPVIEVKASAYPSTGGHQFPSIADWQITYSCPPTE